MWEGQLNHDCCLTECTSWATCLTAHHKLHTAEIDELKAAQKQARKEEDKKAKQKLTKDAAKLNWDDYVCSAARGVSVEDETVRKTNVFGANFV